MTGLDEHPPGTAWALVSRGLAASRLIPVLAGLVALSWAMYWFRGFVQDDAFISLRFASNLAEGKGLVFNEGEFVEGFTNFSWTLSAAVLFKMGLEPLPVLRAVGAFLGLLLVVMVGFEADQVSKTGKGVGLLSGSLASLILGTSTVMGIWSASGMEETPFAFLVFAGFMFFRRGKSQGAAIAWLAATLTRPEGFLVFGVGATVWALSPMFSGKRPESGALRGACLFLIGSLVFLCFRMWYFGSLVPNTFFVKGVSNWESHVQGIQNLREFLGFNWIFVLVAISIPSLLLAVLDRSSPRWFESPEGNGRAFSLVFLLGYTYYLVRVGGEILPFFRLYIPLLPFLALWTGCSIDGILLSPQAERQGRFRAFAGMFLAGLVIWSAFDSVRTSVSHKEFQGVLSSLEGAHGKLGDLVEKIATEDSGRKLTAVAQDMGLIPFRARSVRFVDSIGLTDGVISRLLYERGYTPYIRYLQWNDEGKRKGILEMEDRARAYLQSRDPDLIIINIDHSASEAKRVRDAIGKKDMDVLMPLLGANVFFYGLSRTDWFRTNFELAEGVTYSTNHDLLLFRHRRLSPGR